MAEEINKIPYREGEPAPGPGYILVQMADTSGNDEGMWWVLSDNSKGGPSRRKEVEPLLPMIRWIWKHLRPHLAWCRSFEDWELEFTRDPQPSSAAATWTRQTYTYLEFVHKHPNVDKKAVFGAVMCLMNGQEDRVEPADVAQKLKKLLANAPNLLVNAESFTKDGRLKTKEKHLQ